MIKIVDEISLSNFESWGQATDTKNKILDEGKEDEFENYISDLYPDGLSLGQLNDILAYESQQIFEDLDIEEYDTNTITQYLLKEYKDELLSAYEEDETVEYILPDLIEKSIYSGSVRDSQLDEIVEDIDIELQK